MTEPAITTDDVNSLNSDHSPLAETPAPLRVWKFWGTALWGLLIFVAMFVGQVGAILLLIGTWMLPLRKTWRGIVLFVWALIAITSPLFGWMFLFPWGLLALSLPLVVWILYDARRRA